MDLLGILMADICKIVGAFLTLFQPSLQLIIFFFIFLIEEKAFLNLMAFL